MYLKAIKKFFLKICDVGNVNLNTVFTKTHQGEERIF